MSPGQTLSDDMQRTLLQNAVQPVAELRAVKLQAQQHKTHTGIDLTYQQYCSLLLPAAQEHDQRMFKTPMKAPTRHIYASEVMDDVYNDGEGYGDEPFDIDYPVDLIEVNATSFNRGPRLSYEQWQKLPEDAKKYGICLARRLKL